MSGTDSGAPWAPWARWAYLGATVIVGLLLSYRLLTATGAHASGGPRPVPAPTDRMATRQTVP
jgi:hypothetical protein